MLMKKRILFIALVILVFAVLIKYYFKFQNENKYLEREKAVVFIKNDLNEEVGKVQEIGLSDCREWIVDYDSDRQTILYINTSNQIIEKEMDTAKWQIVNTEALEMNISMEMREQIHNLQYGPGDADISFTYADELYVYNFQTNILKKLTECHASTWRNTYVWMNDEEVCVRADNEIRMELFLYNHTNQSKVELCCGIISFVRNDKEKKMYGIMADPEPHAFGFKLIEKIVEINVEDGSKRELQVVDTENRTLKKYGKFLYYVEQRAEQRKSKIYRIDLESGMKDCIYKTDKDIVGIIVH